MTGLSVNRTQKRAISPVARSQFCHSRLREFVVCSQDIILGLGNDLRVRSLPLSEEFVYLSLAAEIEPEGRCFAGTLESAGVFSHGVLRGIRWFQGATLSSYSMGSPKPSVWTPSWRRTSKAINRRCALNVMIWVKTPPKVKVSAG